MQRTACGRVPRNLSFHGHARGRVPRILLFRACGHRVRACGHVHRIFRDRVHACVHHARACGRVHHSFRGRVRVRAHRFFHGHAHHVHYKI